MPEAKGKERLGAYSDFWARYLAWGVRHCPWSVEPVLVVLYTSAFFVLSGSLRRGVSANLRVLFPTDPAWRILIRAYRVFWSFAIVAVESVRAREAPGVIEWEIVGHGHLEAIRECKQGAIIATAHMGNYDLAGPLFAERFERLIHAVRAPERNASLQAERKKALEGQRDSSYRIVYNEPGSMLGVTLAQALGRNELVAIQADRVLFEVSGMDVQWDEDHTIHIPQGPFLLAQMTGCPIFPLFIIRLGRFRYRVHIGEGFHCPRTARDRKGDLNTAADTWVSVLQTVVKKHWDQWLVVESNFRKISPEDQEAP